MEFLRVDETACIGCGLCSRVCPLQLIVRGAPGEMPQARKGKEEACIACGHCMSVCPVDALEVGALTRSRFRPVRRDVRLSPAEVLHFLRTRRSVRAFREESVPRGDLLAVLDVTRWAPSGHFSQPVRWTLLAGREAVLRAAALTADWMRGLVEAGDPAAGRLHLEGVVRAFGNGKDLICRGAPALALAAAPLPGGSAPTPREDAVIAVAHAELAAHGLGLGACWAGYVTFAAQNHPPLRDYLEVPEGHVVYGGLLLGLPAVRYRAVPPRKKLEVLVKE